jgi:hypothetical protein
MLTARMAHAERERERAHLQNNMKIKPEQLKLGKTYYAKPALRVDPYFQVLGIFNSL